MPIRVFHITARLRRGVPSLSGPETGPWLWEHMRAAFPDAYGATLMPDHPHVAAPGDPAKLRWRMARVLGAFAKRHRLGLGIAEVSVTGPVEDATKLLRLVRYIGLNAPREGLVRDPLAWVFSTHRDVVGAIADPWIDADRLAAAIGRRGDGFGAWYHRYVSADPSVCTRGTEPPQPAEPTVMPSTPLARIADAVQAALRCPADALTQRGPARLLFVKLAHEQGWTHRPQLAAVCGCAVRTIGDLMHRPADAMLPAARLCLGDSRLRANNPTGRAGVVTPVRSARVTGSTS